MLQELFADEICDFRFSSLNMFIDRNENLYPLELAFRLGNIKTINTFIENGAELIKNPQSSLLPLCYGIVKNNSYMYRILIRYQLFYQLEELFIFAIANHKISIIKDLVRVSELYIKEILDIGEKLLICAVENNNNEAVALLLKYGADKLFLKPDFKQKIFSLAAQNKNAQFFNNLALRGIENNVLNLHTEDFYTANQLDPKLLIAINNDDVVNLKLNLQRLSWPISKKFPYNYKDKHCIISILEVAAMEHKLKIIEFILKNNKIDDLLYHFDNISFVHLLMNIADAKSVIKLIETYNIDINCPNINRHCHIIMVAIYAKNYALIDYLLAKMPSLEQDIIAGATIMDLAIKFDNIILVKKLVETYRYNIHFKNYSAQRPLSMAIAEARLEIVKYLISQGANVFAKDGICDRTMLHYAVQSNPDFRIFNLYI